MASTPNTIGFRTAFFFNQDIERPDKYFWELSNIIPEFDVMPTIQPLPEGIKTNGIPLMTFKSQSGIFLCEIKLDRLDFFVRLESHFNLHRYDQIFSIYKQISKTITDYINSQPSLSIKRLGMVGDYLIPAEDPITLIHEMKNIPREHDVVEFALRTNKRKRYANLACNDILIFEALQMLLNDGQRIDGVLLSRDINNVPHETLSAQVLNAFLEEGQEQLSECNFRKLADANE
ncbi:hypothetical protein [Vibrio jasicida]|uniref:hypothetical protein n=1 Tax=Vibrio jasicida TaxID=766224 RepID=UPI000399B21D|nr:hypothetical protein [Vibrio jasicida]